MLVNVNKMPPKRRHLSIYRVKLYFHPTPAADKQQVARLQQALDKVRQGEAFKRLIARYQDVVQSPPADHLPTIE